MTLRVGGIVLCGGQSTRMGTAKASLPFGGEPMVTRVARVLSTVVQPIIVVAAAGQELPTLGPMVRCVRDHRSQCGPLEGMRAGLVELQGAVDAAYVTGCDVPLLVPEFVTKLISYLEDHDAAIPRTIQYWHPLSAIYRVTVLPYVEERLMAGKLRMQELVESLRVREVGADQLRDVDPVLDSLRNVNHPAEYRAALANHIKSQ